MRVETTAQVLAALAIIVVVLNLGGRAAAALGQPAVVGEIVAGVLIGPSVLGGNVATATREGTGLVDAVFPADAFAFLVVTGQIGLVLYMFLVGVELDERLLGGRGLQIAAASVAAAAVPITLGVAVAPLFAGSTWRGPGVADATFALFLGAALAATALPVMARLLQEKGMLATPVGAVGIGVAGIVTVVVFLVLAAASASARGEDVAADLAPRVGLTLALVLGLAVVARPAMAWLVARVDLGRHATPVVATLAALALAAGAAADRIGIDPLVGGFLVGLAVPPSPALVDAVLGRLSGAVLIVLLPVFFAVSGLMTDVRALEPGILPGVGAILALMLLAKAGPGYLAGRATGLGPAEAAALGVLLSCGGLLVLVVGLAGLDLGVITPELHMALVLGAIVSLVLAGPALDRLARR